MRESPRPVVLVPPGADDTRGKHIELRRALVPLDGSALSLRVIDHLLSLPHGADLAYVLLEVVGPGSADVVATADTSARAAAEQRLKAVAERLRAQGVKVVEVRVTEAADPAASIAAAVRRELADFIAMSTHGSSGFKRLVLGSVAERVVRESDVPVLLVTAGERGAHD